MAVSRGNNSFLTGNDSSFTITSFVHNGDQIVSTINLSQNNTINSVVHGSDGLSAVSGTSHVSTPGQRSVIYALEKAGATADAVMTLASKTRSVFAVTSWIDADPASDGTGSNGSGTTNTETPANFSTGDAVVDAVTTQAAFTSFDETGQTAHYSGEGLGGVSDGSASYRTAGAALTFTSGNGAFAHGACRIPQVSGGAASTTEVSDPVTLTLSPQGPTIQAATPSTTEVSDPAVLTFTAPGPTVRTGASVLPQAPAVLTFTPQGPTVRTGASVIPADPAAIVLTAPGPNLESGASIFADPAGLLLSAPGPTVSIVVPGVQVDVDVSGPAVLQYVVPGPTIRRGASVIPDVAQLVFRAEWPTIQAGAKIFGDVAGILINVLNPTVQAGASVSVSSPASLLFAGQGATIRTGASVFSETPSLRLSAPPPTVQVGASVFAGPQTLVITANGPTVSIEGGRVDVDVSTPAFFTLVPGDPTVVAGAIGITKKFGVNLGISVGRESVRDPTRDVGNEGTSDWSED